MRIRAQRPLDRKIAAFRSTDRHPLRALLAAAGSAARAVGLLLLAGGCAEYHGNFVVDKDCTNHLRWVGNLDINTLHPRLRVPMANGDGAARGGGGATNDSGSSSAPAASDPYGGLTVDDDHVGAHEMFPGLDCVGCHQKNKDTRAPQLVAGGTVFPSLHEPDRCIGVAGVKVTITEGDAGRTYERVTNGAGNFFIEEDDARLWDAKNLTVKLEYKGITNAMSAGSSNSGSCHTCHTKTGRGGSPPGRICINGKKNSGCNNNVK